MSEAKSEAPTPAKSAPNRFNRRRYQRRAMNSQVRVSTIDPELDPASGRSFFRTSHETSVDFSRGGLALRTRDPMLPGRRVLIEVVRPVGADGANGPGGEAIEAVGRVAWVRVDPRGEGEQWIGVGVEFLGGQTSALSQLDALLGKER